MRGGWHYIADGDYPLKGQQVLIHVADMSRWIKNTVLSKSAPLGMFEQNATYDGKLNGVDMWRGNIFHGAVVAWRDVPEAPDSDRVKEAIAEFQNMAASRDDVLTALIASSYQYDPAKNAPLIKDIAKKFKREVQKMGTGIITDHNTQPDAAKPLAFIDEKKRVFTVETRHGHGVIVQFDEGQKVARYAYDFPKARRIYPTEREAATALMAEAERQKWRRAG
jgi:hypothetical protein